MTDAQYPKVARAKELTEKVIAAWIETGSHGAHEDFADAFDSVGLIWREVGAQMLHNVYKDDDDAAVRNNVEQMLQVAQDEADAALDDLVHFGIRPTTIDDI